MNSIHQHSRFGHNLDFLISIYSDDKLKTANKMLMECDKTRDAADPPPMELEVDLQSRMVRSSNDPMLDKRVAEHMKRSQGRVRSFSSKIQKTVSADVSFRPARINLLEYFRVSRRSTFDSIYRTFGRRRNHLPREMPGPHRHEMARRGLAATFSFSFTGSTS
jgi:hypothetical protein